MKSMCMFVVEQLKYLENIPKKLSISAGRNYICNRLLWTHYICDVAHTTQTSLRYNPVSRYERKLLFMGFYNLFNQNNNENIY